MVIELVSVTAPYVIVSVAEYEQCQRWYDCFMDSLQKLDRAIQYDEIDSNALINRIHRDALMTIIIQISELIHDWESNPIAPRSSPSTEAGYDDEEDW